MCVNFNLNEREYGHGNALADIEDRERLRIVFKFESQDLLRVGVHCAVLEAPQETHEESQEVELENNSKYYSDQAHHKHNTYVDDSGTIAPVAVNNHSNEEAAQNFAKAEQDHGEAGISQSFFRFPLLIRVCRNHHFNEVSREKRN